MENVKTVLKVALCWADQYINSIEFNLRRDNDEAESIF
jgi:hypothetical protein